MPRNRVKATNRGTTSESTMQKAALLCLDEHMSERSVAKQFNICHVSLNRYIKKFKLHRETGGCLPAIGYRSHNKIFDDFQEKQFAEYVKISADMYFGLNLKNIRKLAYEFAVKLDLTITKNWKHNNEAGPDWIRDFLNRNPSLSNCLPKTNNISRTVNFKPANVKHFMDKYESILLKYKLQAHDIYNLDEMRVTFVQRTKKIVASQGNKHIRVRGKDIVTMCLAINATGNLIPPMYIFSKAANNFNFIQGVDFLKVLKQFANYVTPSVDKKVLILLDSHESHLYLPVIDFCKESGILLLSFPPHYSHKLQPLNRSIYKPFKQFLNQYMSDWVENNPGKKLGSYIVPSVSTSALINAATPRNIIDGFSMSGIWPLNREAFTKDTSFTPAVTADINNMVIDNVDEAPINYVTKETEYNVSEEPINYIITESKNNNIEEPINYVTKETKYNISEEPINYIITESKNNNIEEPINYVTKETNYNISEEPINYIITESKNNNIEEPINYVTKETKNTIIEEPINYVIKEIKNNIIKEPKNHIFITPHILRPARNSTHPSTPTNDLQPSTSIISPEYIKPYLKPVLQDKKMINKEKTTIFTYTPEKLEIENVTKNNAKRNIVFKTKKNKKLKS
ncbi:uncharacterized protein LOC132926267 [Rhopalosiphum padi]|uniref:uncharacterized protein LOC132926267 n=1 Tax=Rhopalosiphum padi TaxID=40932 RepID=UPI00298D6315|nr:uncharacterized protein LOC132926267 [Rhopalosiphum padi]